MLTFPVFALKVTLPERMLLELLSSRPMLTISASPVRVNLMAPMKLLSSRVAASVAWANSGIAAVWSEGITAVKVLCWANVLSSS